MHYLVADFFQFLKKTFTVRFLPSKEDLLMVFVLHSNDDFFHLNVMKHQMLQSENCWIILHY